MLVFVSISLKICLASGAPPQTLLKGLQHCEDQQLTSVGGGGGCSTSASAFSLGHQRNGLKKVENPCASPTTVFS